MGIGSTQLIANRRRGVDAPLLAVRTRRTRSGAPAMISWETTTEVAISCATITVRSCELRPEGWSPLGYNTGNDTALRASPDTCTAVSLPRANGWYRAVTAKVFVDSAAQLQCALLLRGQRNFPFGVIRCRRFRPPPIRIATSVSTVKMTGLCSSNR
jgi:hypothetical protein